MFADITLLLIVGLSGIGLFVFGVISRHGILCLIGCLALLFMIVGYEGYSVDTWMAGAVEDIKHYDVISRSFEQTIFNATDSIDAIYVSSSSSQLVGDTVNCAQVWLRKTGSPPVETPVIVAVFDNNGVTKHEFGRVNVTSLTSVATAWQFCDYGTDYTIVSGDHIGISYQNGDSSNAVVTQYDGSNPFDGDIVYSQRFDSSTGSWVTQSTGWDMMAILSYEVAGSGESVELYTVEYSFPDQIRAVSGVTVGVVLFFSMRKFGFS